jgi:hypothetical protein
MLRFASAKVLLIFLFPKNFSKKNSFRAKKLDFLQFYGSMRRKKSLMIVQIYMYRLFVISVYLLKFA